MPIIHLSTINNTLQTPGYPREKSLSSTPETPDRWPEHKLYRGSRHEISKAGFLRITPTLPRFRAGVIGQRLDIAEASGNSFPEHKHFQQLRKSAKTLQLLAEP